MTGAIKKVIFLIIALFYQYEAGYSMEKLMAVTLEYPPFNYTDQQTKEVIGATPTLLKMMFKDLGYEVEIQSLPWKRSQSMIKEGTAHIIFTYTRSHKRQKVAYYSNPISTIRAIFVKNRNSPVPSSWKKLSDLKNYEIGINEGYNYPPVFMEALKNQLFSKLQPLSTEDPTQLNLQKLLKNRIDYFICSVDCIYAINQLPEKDKKMIERIDHIIGSERTLHVGFAKNNPNWKSAEKVRQKFNDLFDQYLKAGKVKSIYQRYNIDIKYEMLGSTLNINWDNTLDQ